MDSDSITQIIFIAILIFMSAYFSASETAFFSMNKIRIKNMASEGSKRAKLVLKLSDDYDKLLSSILIGNNIVNIASSAIATVLFIKIFQDSGPSVSTAVMTVVVLLFGEITPKSIAKNSPEKFALFSAPILNFINHILAPLNFIFIKWQKLVNMIIKPGDDRGVTEEELLTMVEEAQNDGEIDDYESELIKNAIEFNDIEVIDIHTNRVDLVAINEDSDINKVKEIFNESGYSRIPVYRKSIDNIVGILNQKDFNREISNGKTLTEIMTKPVFIIPSMKISQLLTLLQKNQSHMAVIIDEYGGTVGIVTLEDIIEELVGEIWDEHDEIVQNFIKISDTKYKVLCSTNLDEMLEKLGIENNFDMPTVSGWVIDTFKHIPKVGESFEYKNLKITVTNSDSRHVHEIMAEILPKNETEDYNDE